MLGLSVGQCTLAAVALCIQLSAGRANESSVQQNLKALKTTEGFYRNCEPCGGYFPKMKKKKGGKKFRIVGGKRSLTSKPWLAFLQILPDSRCSGALLNARFVLTAAHCVCTTFECPLDEIGNRTTYFDPQGKIIVFLGLKKLKDISENMAKLRKDQLVYDVSKVIVHPEYDDSLHDLSLVQTAQPVAFSAKVQPVCLPTGALFPDVRADATVAGWGTLRNRNCFTNSNGPAPNSMCLFPFQQDGLVLQTCFKGPNPSAKDPTCATFRKGNPDAMLEEKSEVQLFNMDLEPVRTCYKPDGGSHGWCAACRVDLPLTDPNNCAPGDRYEPANTTADTLWGWCNKHCDSKVELLPDTLHELSLTVFHPQRCQELMNATGAPFDPGTEFCAGFVYKKRKRSFVMDGKSFKEVNKTHTEYDLIGGRDACTGDSGAPLWINVGRGGRQRAFAVGVVSRGFNCAMHNQPGIYVRVKMFLDWIKGAMGEEGQNCGREA